VLSIFAFVIGKDVGLPHQKSIDEVLF